MKKQKIIFIREKGFTLIELLVSIGIIGIVVTLTITAFRSATEKAKVARWQSQISSLKYATGLVGHYDFSSGSGTTLRNTASGYGLDTDYVPDALHGTISGGGEYVGGGNTCALPGSGDWTYTGTGVGPTGGCDFDANKASTGSVIVDGLGIAMNVLASSILEIDFDGGKELGFMVDGNGDSGAVVVDSGGMIAQQGSKIGAGSTVSWGEGRWTDKYALALDGTDDFINLGNDANLNFGADEFTIIAWFKTAGRTGIDMQILTKGAKGSTPGFALTQRASDDGTAPSKIVISVVDADADVVSTSSTTLTDNSLWHVAAVVRDNTSSLIRLYIDGEEENTVSSTIIGNITTSTNLNIGRQGEGAPIEYFNGSIDEVYVYNIALSPEQIRDNYEFGKP